MMFIQHLFNHSGSDPGHRCGQRPFAKRASANGAHTQTRAGYTKLTRLDFYMDVSSFHMAHRTARHTSFSQLKFIDHWLYVITLPASIKAWGLLAGAWWMEMAVFCAVWRKPVSVAVRPGPGAWGPCAGGPGVSPVLTAGRLFSPPSFSLSHTHTHTHSRWCRWHSIGHVCVALLTSSLVSVYSAVSAFPTPL